MSRNKKFRNCWINPNSEKVQEKHQSRKRIKNWRRDKIYSCMLSHTTWTQARVNYRGSLLKAGSDKFGQVCISWLISESLILHTTSDNDWPTGTLSIFLKYKHGCSGNFTFDKSTMATRNTSYWKIIHESSYVLWFTLSTTLWVRVGGNWTL